MTPRFTLAAAGLATAGAVTAGLLMPATASADTVIPLRDATQSAKVGSGSIVITVKGQRARLSPGMVALPTTRNAWVSGTVSVKVNGAEADGGSIEAGYAVGCQIDVGDASIDLGAGAESGATFNDPDAGTGLSPSIKGTTGGSIKLAAGSVGTQALTYDRATWPKPGDEVAPDWYAPSTSFDFTGASGSFTYSDQTIGVDGCAGYAQARLYVIAKAGIGNSKGTVILWGAPFTLG
ncbi:MspA family porin [Tsukamurella paurometabola]|uniref:MspA n=1 Tax=Tsukamurella paurometabola TaxID=2061 RepID=A0A3P8MB45_TSUPA|nr:MspA family porin [Tsukamurella paurometabola]UEA84915.1 MspA family porin [Tsukamurella paurometabola]VDR37506.1 MspA [Tsukamurella paurometabola]